MSRKSIAGDKVLALRKTMSASRGSSDTRTAPEDGLRDGSELRRALLAESGTSVDEVFSLLHPPLLPLPAPSPSLKLLFARRAARLTVVSAFST